MPATSSTDVLSKRLLVVDDEEGPRQSLNMIFCDDFNVTIATSGEEAVSFSKEQPFDVVITDIRMRGLSGPLTRTALDYPRLPTALHRRRRHRRCALPSTSTK